MRALGALMLSLMALPVAAQEVTSAPGAILRWLDKVTGETADIELADGQSALSGRLTIQLDECRYPTANPASDAYAHLTVLDEGQPNPAFSGWMVASSPALSALEHPRYDVWVLRCLTPDQPELEVEPPPATEDDFEVPQEG